jgi:hypothetical protein
VRPPPSLCSIVSAALVPAFGPKVLPRGEHQEAGLVEPGGVGMAAVLIDLEVDEPLRIQAIDVLRQALDERLGS